MVHSPSWRRHPWFGVSRCTPWAFPRGRRQPRSPPHTPAASRGPQWPPRPRLEPVLPAGLPAAPGSLILVSGTASVAQADRTRTAVRPPSDLSARRQFIRTSPREAPAPLALWELSGRVNTSSGQTAQGVPAERAACPRKPCQPRAAAPFQKGSGSSHGTGGESRGDRSPPSRALDWSAGSRDSRNTLNLARSLRRRMTAWPHAGAVSGWGQQRSPGEGPLAKVRGLPAPLESSEQLPGLGLSLCPTPTPLSGGTRDSRRRKWPLRTSRALSSESTRPPGHPRGASSPSLLRKGCKLLSGHSVSSRATSSM